MKKAMDYEINVGWKPVNVSANNEGYDIKSISPEELKPLEAARLACRSFADIRKVA